MSCRLVLSVELHDGINLLDEIVSLELKGCIDIQWQWQLWANGRFAPKICVTDVSSCSIRTASCGTSRERQLFHRQLALIVVSCVGLALLPRLNPHPKLLGLGRSAATGVGASAGGRVRPRVGELVQGVGGRGRSGGLGEV